jgi:hypothetical protein
MPNQKSSIPAAVLLSALTFAAAANAESPTSQPPLSREALAQCAQQALSLRTDSQRLNADNDRFDVERTQINAEKASIEATAASVAKDDLNAHLALHQRNDAHVARATEFNARIEAHKRQIDQINGVKQQYDRNCSGRPYRRAELEALPAPLQDAMRRGLQDVVVPYLDPAAR